MKHEEDLAHNYNSILNRAVIWGTEMVPETSILFNQLTWLIAREDLIDFESFKF
jgi:hypothetical protein